MSSRTRLTLESWRRFCEFVPEMRRPWCAALVGGGVVVAWGLCLVLGSMVASAFSPYGAPLVQGAFVLWGGAWMRAGFWPRRAAYRQRYGALAYRHLFFRFLLPALLGVGAAPYFPVLVGGERLLPPALAYALAAYLLVTMQMIASRDKEVFWNFDLRAFVYSVFPERGRVMTSGIFRWLRHPVYSAMMRFTFALALLRNNAPALLCAAIVSVGLWLWSRVEEGDLSGLDADYAGYRRRVPAFFVPHPVRFWRYLLTGKDARQGQEPVPATKIDSPF